MLSHEKYSDQPAGILSLSHHPNTLILANPPTIYNPSPPNHMWMVSFPRVSGGCRFQIFSILFETCVSAAADCDNIKENRIGLLCRYLYVIIPFEILYEKIHSSMLIKFLLYWKMDKKTEFHQMAWRLMIGESLITNHVMTIARSKHDIRPLIG